MNISMINNNKTRSAAMNPAGTALLRNGCEIGAKTSRFFAPFSSNFVPSFFGASNWCDQLRRWCDWGATEAGFVAPGRAQSHSVTPSRGSFFPFLKRC